jgi:uncharacterized protein (DUF1697 family)
VTRYIALLRGINVGPTTAVAMADLKASFEALGLDEVETYVRSGNVVFTGKATAAALEKRIAADFGRAYPVVVRSAAELKEDRGGKPVSDQRRQEAPRRLPRREAEGRDARPGPLPAG